MEDNHWWRLQLHLRRKRYLSKPHAKIAPDAIAAPQLSSQTKKPTPSYKGTRSLHLDPPHPPDSTHHWLPIHARPNNKLIINKRGRLSL
jgi:hypothetical protein